MQRQGPHADLKGCFHKGLSFYFYFKKGENNSLSPWSFHIVKMFEYQRSKDRKSNFREFFFQRTK